VIKYAFQIYYFYDFFQPLKKLPRYHQFISPKIKRLLTTWPISVLPVFSKVLERIVYNRLSFYLEENKLLNDSQYGFRLKRSTKHAVTILMDDIRTSMDNQQLTGAVFLDLRKAFDTVNHARLLNKLPSYGINDVELMCVSSHLLARTQVV
jgi:hypothetical protein